MVSCVVSKQVASQLVSHPAVPTMKDKRMKLDDDDYRFGAKLQQLVITWNEERLKHVSEERIKSSRQELMTFNTLEVLSLYTTMMVKRYVKDNKFFCNHLIDFIKLIENNLAKLKIEKKWFFATIRDQARLHHNEWDEYVDGVNEGRMQYNCTLLLVALLLGMEKVWVSDGCLPFDDNKTVTLIKLIFENAQPSFALKQLSQTDPMFEFLASHSPYLEVLHLPHSDVSSFQSCVKFENLRVIELAGGVSDKVMCNALWNISKRSDKVLDMVIKMPMEIDGWHLSLPHLEVLRTNMLQCPVQTNAMRLSLGAAALAIQPSLKIVETLQSWDTYGAVLYLLDREAKQRKSNGIDCNDERKLNVTSLTVNYEKNLDMEELKRVMQACPKLSHLTINNAENIQPDLALLCEIIPVKQVKNLTVDVSKLTNLELTVLLAEMSSLEHLTLKLTPQAIVKFNVPIEGETRAMLPAVKTLQIEFLSTGVDSLTSLNNFLAKDMMSFLSTFKYVKELYFHNTLFVPPSYVVYGCIGGSLTMFNKLRHLSVISCDDTPREAVMMLQDTVTSRHHRGVPRMLADLQNETTFKHMRDLESLEIDEFYISPRVDSMIEALRLSGVKVAVLYHPQDKKKSHSCVMKKRQTLRKI
ncbi:uncharacterized protein [Cherax quadricarinatus]|uniref:uncharacterized protein isoform X2 n=1 Tax=Cherax quadricarinatus TaxID=27406 RepID=UPI00237833BD|nr:uncharacterized protein LOC128684911 isoform X2 [Cherax quadricarinatus]